MRTIFVISLFLIVSCGSNVKDEKTSPLPTTLEGAIEEIVGDLSDEDKLTVKEQNFCDLIMYHHGWGTGIRNSFGLWRGNTELLKSACGGEECHPDDASMQIIYGVWNSLNGLPLRHKPDDGENCDRELLIEINE